MVHLRCIAKEYSIGSFAKQIYHTVQLIIKQLAKVGMNKTTAEKYHRKYKGSVKRIMKNRPSFSLALTNYRLLTENPVKAEFNGLTVFQSGLTQFSNVKLRSFQSKRKGE